MSSWCSKTSLEPPAKQIEREKIAKSPMVGTRSANSRGLLAGLDVHPLAVRLRSPAARGLALVKAGGRNLFHD